MLSLCLHLSSFTLYLLITDVIMINFSLECFINLDLASIHLFAHILFVYKLVLVILNLGGFKRLLVLYTLIELSGENLVKT